MLETIKKLIKDFNTFFDGQSNDGQLWTLIGLTVLGLALVNAESSIVTLLGFIYFGGLFFARWLHYNGKL